MPVEQLDQEGQLIQNFNRKKHQVAKNRVLLVSGLNFLTLLSFIFAMAFYKWVWIEFNLEAKNQNSPRVSLSQKQSVKVSLWLNLLYVRQAGQGGYQSFTSAKDKICNVEDPFCEAIFYQFSFIGYLSFSIMSLAACLQLYDFFLMFYFVFRTEISLEQHFEQKDNFRLIVIVTSYGVGLTLSLFGVEIIEVEHKQFGVSFWVAISTLLMFIGVVVYQQISVRNMMKQSLIMNLIEGEKKIRSENIEQLQKNIEMSSQGDFSL